MACLIGRSVNTDKYGIFWYVMFTEAFVVYVDTGGWMKVRMTERLYVS